MGCMKSKSSSTPSQGDKRQMMAEAAERRQKELESRGIKDVEKLKRKEESRRKIEEKAQQAPSHTPLQWTAN